MILVDICFMQNCLRKRPPGLICAPYRRYCLNMVFLFHIMWIAILSSDSFKEEIPYVRFQRALNDRKFLFREFQIKPPYQSIKDIFCLRRNRTINPYRKISLNNLQLKVNGAAPDNTVNLRIYPMSRGKAEVRFWCNDEIIDVQKVKNSDLNIVHF